MREYHNLINGIVYSICLRVAEPIVQEVETLNGLGGGSCLGCQNCLH